MSVCKSCRAIGGTHRRWCSAPHRAAINGRKDSMSDTPIYDQMMREAERNADDAHTLRRSFAVMSA